MNQNPQIGQTNIDEDAINIGSLLDSLWLDKKLVALIAISIFVLGTAYALMAKPIFEANLLIQVEEPGSTKTLLGDASALFDVKTAAASEIEILSSRMVVANAVDSLGLYISVRPKFFPFFGRWLASKNEQLSKPGIMGLGGYVWGRETIHISAFSVPQAMWSHQFILMADGAGGFELNQTDFNISIQGRVGQPLVYETPAGEIELLVLALDANAGAQFILIHNSRLRAIETLQKSLNISEKGRLSGIIEVKLEGGDPQLTAKILNAVGNEYIRQNVDRMSEEAEKSISFLDSQLPKIKNNLEEAETKYNRLRNKRGIIDISSEANNILQQAIGVEIKLWEVKREREELLTKFTREHPSVAKADSQILFLEKEKYFVHNKIKGLPRIEQDIISSTRDVEVSNELYISLLNTLQQLRLAKASKIGTSRIVDTAVAPERPIKPKRLSISLASLLLGLLLGVITAFIRKAMRGTIDNPRMIEDMTGLQVYATIMESEHQESLSKQIQAKKIGQFLLAEEFPDDIEVESLRSFRVAMQFAMLDAPNNRVMITGPTPGVGKTFLAANMAVVLAQADKRVLLIDMDMHKGHLNRYFGLSRKAGLSELLAGEITVEQAIHKNILGSLSLITNGTEVSNPSSLFLSERLPQILDRCSQLYDIVIVDASPALLVSDVAVIGPHMGTTFMVVRDGASTIVDLISSIKRLNQARVEVKGVLFNGQLLRISNRYKYGYQYGYGYKYGYSGYKQKSRKKE